MLFDEGCIGCRKFYNIERRKIFSRFSANGTSDTGYGFD